MLLTASILLGLIAGFIAIKIFNKTGEGLIFDTLLGLSAQGVPMENKGTKGYDVRRSSHKANILNRFGVAFVVGAVLLVGTSLPSKAQQQETQQRQADQKEQKAEQRQQKQAEQQLDKKRQVQQQQETQQQINQQKAEQRQQKQAEQKQIKQERAEQRRLSQKQQQQLINHQKELLAQYRNKLQQQQRLEEQRIEKLQQQKRMAQYRFQQQYSEDLRQQQIRLQNEQNYNYNNDPYFYTAPSYRYSRNGSYYETNQYGADLLKQAVNYGYAQGSRAGQADREDGWGYNYKDSYAYQDANYGYNGMYMDQNEYNHYFREGFSRGYEDSYNSRYQYGSNSGGRYSILETIMSQILNFQSII